MIAHERLNAAINKSKFLYFIYIILSLSCSSLFADERLNYNNNVQCTQSDNSSLPLKIFIYQFLESHPSIQAAKANVAAANARFHAAEQPLYNPELIAETEQKRQKSFKDPELALEGEKPYEKTYTAGLNQTVDWVSKRSARSKVADRNFHIAESQLESLQQQLATVCST